MDPSLLDAPLAPSLPEPVPPLGRPAAVLRVPEVGASAREEARRWLETAVPVFDRETLDQASPQRLVAPAWLFRSLPFDEARARFFELAGAGALYAPDEPALRYLVAELGADVLPFVERWAPAAPLYAAELGSREATRTLARLAASGDDPERSASARAWLDAHPERAVDAMLEQAGGELALAYGDTMIAARAWLAERVELALGPAVDLALAVGEPPDRALCPLGSPARTLRWLARRAGRDAVLAARPEAPRERLEALLDLRWDQRFVVSMHLPKWWPLEAPIARAGGGTLDGEPRARVFALLERTPTPDHPQALALRAALDPSSAEQLAVAIVEAFVADKAKPMYRWTLAAALALGPRAIVPRVARLAWRWSRDDNRNHRNLVAPVIEQLTQLGDADCVARLALLAEGLAQPTHRQAAQNALALLALDRGVSADELAASVLPELALGADGRATVDFGARSFVARFGPDGKPSFTDAQGKPIARLPKPGKKDDAAIAEASLARFAELADEVRHLVRAEARRLEEALRLGRRWKASQLRVIAAHPLRRPLVSALLWSSGEARFRISEELEWLDASDVPVAIDDDALVALAHPIDLGEAEHQRWSTVWGDYALVSPFPQLARPVHRAEVRGGRVDACQDWEASTGALVGLLSSGWIATWARGGIAGAQRRVEGGHASIEWEAFSPREVRDVPTTTLGSLEVAGAASTPAILSELLVDLSRARRG